MASYFNNKNKNSKNRPNQNHRRREVVADNSNVQESKNGCLILEGKVMTDQVNSIFHIEVDLQGRIFSVNAQLSGKLRVNKIKIVRHDIVILEVPISELQRILEVPISELQRGFIKINGRIKQRKDPPKIDDTMLLS